MKEYYIKRHYCTKHASKFDGIESQLLFDEIEQFEKSEHARGKMIFRKILNFFKARNKQMFCF